MSVITELVIHSPHFFGGDLDTKLPPDNEARQLGRVLYEAVCASQGKEADPDYWYRPIPDQLKGVDVSDGGKLPCNAVWWLAVNHLDFDAFTDYLATRKVAHGIAISYETEASERLWVHVVGEEGR